MARLQAAGELLRAGRPARRRPANLRDRFETPLERRVQASAEWTLLRLHCCLSLRVFSGYRRGRASGVSGVPPIRGRVENAAAGSEELCFEVLHYSVEAVKIGHGPVSALR